MNKIVVIGSDHHNTLGVIRGLGERGVRSDVVIVASSKLSFVAKSKYINKVLFVSSDTKICKCLVENYKNETEKPVIICCSDSIESEIDQHYNHLKEFFLLPGTDTQGRITEMMSKQRMAELALDLGLNVPNTWYFDDVLQDISDVSLPCIVKPIVSKDGSKEDIRVFKEEKELQEFIAKRKFKKAQIQEFIDKDFEYQLIGCATKNEVIIPGVSKILRPCRGSNTSFLHYIILEKNFCDIKKCKEFVIRTGYKGLFSLEFLRDKKGKDYFLEINFRNDGNAICTTAAGMSLPYIWYLNCIGQDYSKEANKKIKPVYVMPDMAELKLLFTGQINIFEYLCDLKRTDCFMEYNKRDQKPFWTLLRKKIKE